MEPVALYASSLLTLVSVAVKNVFPAIGVEVAEESMATNVFRDFSTERGTFRGLVA